MKKKQSELKQENLELNKGFYGENNLNETYVDLLGKNNAELDFNHSKYNDKDNEDM
jgi:hypothetical protein